MTDNLPYVLIRIRWGGAYILGRLAGENDRIIDLKDALQIQYRMITDKGPELFFTKFCLFTKSFDTGFKKDDISHIFRDPLDNILDLYEDTVVRMKETMAESLEKEDDMTQEDDEDLEALTEMLLKRFNNENIH